MNPKLLIVFANCLVICAAIQCKDENNEDVDWFITYKLPKLKHYDELISDGFGYIFVTSQSSAKWTYSKQSINDTKSIIGNTLEPFYSKPNSTSYVFYNDQPPNEASKASKGHTKGVILADDKTGFWLIHSTPHFPETRSYLFPSTGTQKGQSFLCISMDLNNLNEIGVQLQYNEPQIYSAYISATIEGVVKELSKAVANVTTNQPPWYHQSVLTSIQNVKFVSFAKTKWFRKDLYEDWLAPALQADFLVETWLNGAGRLASNCSKPFKVYNIEKVLLNVNVTFESSHDHSKWAVSQNSDWICIGDINRMEHQEMRGGGTVCLNNTKLAQDYRDAVVLIEKCKH